VSAVLALRDVRRVHSAGFVLDVPALDVMTGELLAIMGPNGSGKSTLLRVLGLLERPEAGSVHFHGRPVDARDALAERRRMATVFQEPLLADATAADNVALGLRFRSLDRDAIAPRVAAWLERLGVGALGARQARTLSGGEAQRVALARALVLEPEVLLLDEPFSGLDTPSRRALIADLGRVLRQDRRVTTVFVTHDRSEARALADRIAVLMDGRIQQLDTAAGVFQSPVSESVARFVGVETIVSGRVIEHAAGLARVDVAGRTLRVAAKAAPGTHIRLAIRSEDVILSLPRELDEGTSALNVLAGVVTRITVTDSSARVVVDCGFPLVARVTPRSIDELGLAEGVRIAAIFKATSPHVISTCQSG
jgi:tungstate transport system ATP-binding protein